MAMSSARRRYTYRVATCMVGYVSTLFAADWLIDERGIAGAPALAAALVPALFVAGVFWALARLLVEETDEYQRLLLVRQLLIGSAITLTIVTIWGFWENFGLVGHIDAFYIAALFFVGMGVGGLVNRLTLGDGGC
ncbi:MAG TPA: hypothetical protein VFO51_09345 [Sphingomicrobium sp.]|nr:hypothetical protein [Sphingomicrobium sp.]